MSAAFCDHSATSMPVIFESFYLGPEGASKVGGKGRLKVTIRNDSPTKMEAQRLEVQQTDYWQPLGAEVPALAPRQSHSVNVDLCAYLTTDMGPQKVPETVSFKLSKSGQQHSVALCFSFFVNGLKEYSPVGLPGAAGCECFNILPVGLAGSGKSSTINSMLTLMDEPGQPRFRITRAVPMHGTPTVNVVAVSSDFISGTLVCPRVYCDTNSIDCQHSCEWLYKNCGLF